MKTIGMSKLALLTAALLALASSTSDAQRRVKGNVAPSAQNGTNALSGTDLDRAAAAAKELGTSKSAKAVDTLLDALAMGLHPRVAAAALDALAVQGKPQSFDVVAFYVNHRNAKVRSAAFRAMGALSDKRANVIVLDGLRDPHKSVRAVAAGLLTESGDKRAIEPLIALLKKGDEAAAPALAALADPDLARAIAELIGAAPEGLLARCLGAILMRPDFKPEEARVEVVKALGKIPGSDSLEQLSNYVDSLPEKPPRESRTEAEAIMEARLGGS